MILCKNGVGYAVGTPEGTVYDDGETNGDDSVGDFQNATAYSSWYTGSGRSNCNETNFSDVSSTIVPDDSKREASSSVVNVDGDGDPNTGPGSIAWTKVFRDDLTGLYFSNVLVDSGTGMTWPQALSFCAGLNGGTAGNGWRVPTQKELMQLYINGVSKLADLGNVTQYFWSSSTLSSTTTNAWRVALGAGQTLAASAAKTVTLAFVCVR